MTKLAVIGAGKMGEAITAGIVAAGWSPSDIVLCDVRGEHVRDVAAKLGVQPFDSAAGAVVAADAVLLAVRPQDGDAALKGISLEGKHLISILAIGWPTERLEAAAPGAHVVRAMPSVAARVRSGVTALAAGTTATQATQAIAQSIFEAIGQVEWLDERFVDMVTALSASGIAYVFLFAEAMVDGAVSLGLPRTTAETFAYGTLGGAARMLQELGEHPAVLRAQVTTPGGTTAAGVAELERGAVRSWVIEAIRAAQQRSKESS